MNLDIATLPEDTAALKDMIVFLADAHTDLEEKTQAKIASLEERIRLLQNELFGRKSEKHIPPEKDQQQLYLFDEPGLPEPEKADTITVPAHTRKKRGRKPLPKDLPRIDVIHDIDESEKVCACGCPLSRIDEEVSEKLDIIPAKMQVIRHIRYKVSAKLSTPESVVCDLLRSQVLRQEVFIFHHGFSEGDVVKQVPHIFIGLQATGFGCFDQAV